MSIFAKPISLYEVGTGGDRVYLPGITFAFAEYCGVEAIRYAIQQRDTTVGTWTYCAKTGVTELNFIQGFPNREWFTESTASHNTQTVRKVAQ